MMIFLRIFLLTFKLVAELVYLPIRILRLFKKPQKCPPIRDKILLLRASELAERIRKKQITSVAVVKAYISRIKEVNSIINAVIDNRFEEALQDAEEADRLVSKLSEQEIKEKYPLLGVPITVKGSVAVKGMRHTAGRVDHNVIAAEDSIPVGHARECGAIPLLTSNVPELCMNWETTNKLIGTTSNPYNTCRTPGGSSGGEASLLGCGASLIGIGSDIAGSLRLPAHCCGVWGHKPSPHVVSCVGHYPDCKNRNEWNKVFTLGPMARYATDLKLLLDVIAETSMKGVLKLDKAVDVKKIKVYYMEGIQSRVIDPTSEDVLAAIRKVVNHFDTDCDSKCTKIQIPIMEVCTELSYLSMLNIDGVENIFNDRGDGAYPELKKFLRGKSKYTLTAIGYGILRHHIHSVPSKSMIKINMLLEKLRQYLLTLLGDNGILILPTIPTEAGYKADIYRKLFNSGYLSVFNSLGFPATNCPVMFSKNGMPIGVQVVAAPNMDRLTLAVAEELEKAFGGWKFE